MPGKEHLTPFALDVGAFALRLFADYYAIPYPGDKCDLIALLVRLQYLAMHV